jgi:phytol kinase
MNLLSDVAVLLGTSMAFVGVFGFGEWARRRLTSEAARKLVHVGCGTIAAPLAFWVENVWLMAVFGAALVGLLNVASKRGWLRSVDGVARGSRGVILFPLGAFAAYALASAAEAPGEFAIALFVLATADAAAALVGGAWGRRPMVVGCRAKTLEGSCTFFVTATAVVVLGQVVLLGTGWSSAAMIGIGVASLTTLVELISRRGWDNVWVPVTAVVALLAANSPESSAALALLGSATWLAVLSISTAALIPRPKLATGGLHATRI